MTNTESRPGKMIDQNKSTAGCTYDAPLMDVSICVSISSPPLLRLVIEFS